ncbi:MAG: DUF4392 domain-containing protein [Lachnospiraceae bacterium]|nr:DUF4392 domain-containing protein [Lachnospiraceae bacterium]
MEAERTETIEDIILRYSERGMPDIRLYLSTDYCTKAAKEILSWERGNVFLTTGFYVKGYAETDGPVGTVALAHALSKIGYDPIIITDEFCRGFFEPEDIETIYVELDNGDRHIDDLIKVYEPKGLISIERCGKNKHGKYTNMRGEDIGAFTAPIDEMFLKYQGIIPTIGVGDGGNEIGMGKIAGPVSRKLSLEPCVIPADIFVIATVSNWGAYGIVAALSKLCKQELVPGFDWVQDYIKKTVKLGSVDGVSGWHSISVDGKSMKTEHEILRALRKFGRNPIKDNCA